MQRVAPRLAPDAGPRPIGIRSAVPGIAAVFAFIICSVTMGCTLEPLAGILVATCQLATTVLWVYPQRARRWDIFEPIHLSMVVFLFAFWLPLLLDPGSVQGGALQETCIVLAAAQVAFTAGYRLSSAEGFARRAPQVPLLHREFKKRAVPWLFAIWALSVLLRLGYTYSANIGTAGYNPGVRLFTAYDNVLLVLTETGPYCLFAAMIIVAAALRPSRRLFVAGMVALCLEAAVELVGGWKAGILVIAIGGLCAVRMNSGRSRWMFPLVGVVIGSALLVLPIAFGIMGAYRQRAATAGISVESLLSSADQQTSDAGNNLLIERISYGHMLGRLIAAVDTGLLPREYGGTLWPALTFLIPRSLWPSKPVISVGALFAHQVLGWSGDGAEAAVTLIGDFYWNFGIVGVVAGMLWYGMLLRFCYEYLIRCISTVAATVVYLPVLLVLTLTIERNFAAIVSQAVQIGAVLAIVVISVSRRAQNHRHDLAVWRLVRPARPQGWTAPLP